MKQAQASVVPAAAVAERQGLHLLAVWKAVKSALEGDVGIVDIYSL